MVTNIEADHLDIYDDLADIRHAFAQFVGTARAIVLCGEDAGASGLRLPTGTEVIRYAIADGTRSAESLRDARLVAHAVRHGAGGSSFELEFDGEALGTVVLNVPGRHNILNALAALASGLVVSTTKVSGPTWSAIDR